MLIDTADPQTFLQPSSSFHRYATVCVSQKNGDASSIPAQILNLIIAPSQLYTFPDFARRLDVKVSVTVISTTRSIIIHASFLIPTLRDSNSDICYELNISIVAVEESRSTAHETTSLACRTMWPPLLALQYV
ncbi:hypothetical protein LENED_008188 [Lentinula edodes]|uniref:Uncharacterized protein n=1 Tax=Lentinula edodes TaxID=5353 RepID=A0A1Q3EGG7_LENED|nr:hypothetical protein LENED_008188 [Lentinula edodes]